MSTEKKQSTKGNYLALSGLALAISMGAHASESNELMELKKRVAELEKQQQSAPKIKVTGAGINIVDKKAKTSFKVNGRLHLDANLYDGAYNAKSDGDNANDIFARRARLGISGNNADWHYKLTLAFGGNAENGRIQNAILSYNGFKKSGGPQIQLGKIKEDTTLESSTSSNHITAISRPMIANAVSPFFNWGARVNQYFPESGIRYALGVYEAADAGFGDGAAKADSGKDESNSTLLAYTGRLNWAPVAKDTEVLHLGAWGSYRDFGGSILEDRVARGEVRNTSVRVLDYAAGGDKVAIDSIQQYGVEFAGVYGPLSLQAEYVKRSVESAESGGNEPDLNGYYLTASYFLTGESRNYVASKGIFKQPKGVKGAWEVLARYSSADATFQSQGTEVDIVTLGANYYVNPNLRFMVNYLHTNVDGPGASALVGQETDANAITIRSQYMF